MSNSHDEHESVIKTPKQLIVAVLAAFVVPIIVVVLLVKYVTSGHLPNAGSDAQTPEAIAAPKIISREDLARCEELGAAFSAGLATGIF